MPLLKHSAVTSSIVDSVASLATFIDSLADLPADPPSLYIDLEGVNLSREGSISLIEVFVFPKNHVYLIDVYNLKDATFTTTGKEQRTLKSVFESATIPKVFFDVRNDSDALFAHFGIALQGIQDVQLMEIASRSGHISGKKFLSGLASCIEKDTFITSQEKQLWKITKSKGQALFDPAKGGSYQIFNIRPLSTDIGQYCVQDVQFLPHLRSVYWGKLDLEWKIEVEKETLARVWLSQSSAYQPHGADKAFGPWQVPQPKMAIEDYSTYEDEADHERDLDDWWDDQEDNDFEDWTGNPSPNSQ